MKRKAVYKLFLCICFSWGWHGMIQVKIGLVLCKCQKSRKVLFVPPTNDPFHWMVWGCQKLGLSALLSPPSWRGHKKIFGIVHVTAGITCFQRMGLTQFFPVREKESVTFLLHWHACFWNKLLTQDRARVLLVDHDIDVNKQKFLMWQLQPSTWVHVHVELHVSPSCVNSASHTAWTWTCDREVDTWPLWPYLPQVAQLKIVQFDHLWHSSRHLKSANHSDRHWDQVPATPIDHKKRQRPPLPLDLGFTNQHFSSSGDTAAAGAV